MGFLDGLLKKEARKFVSDIVGKAVDNTASTVADKVTDTVKEKTGFGNQDNVFEKIKNVVDTEFPDYELRENVKASEFGGESGAASYTYGIYRDATPVMMINVFVDRNAYRLKRYRLAREAAEFSGVKCLSFFSHLPNETSYIIERLRANMQDNFIGVCHQYKRKRNVTLVAPVADEAFLDYITLQVVQECSVQCDKAQLLSLQS